MNLRRIRNYILSFAALISFVFAVGRSVFLIQSGNNSLSCSGVTNNRQEAVCYVKKSGVTDVYWTDLSSCIESTTTSGSTIYVLPQSNPSESPTLLKKTCTLSSGVTMTLLLDSSDEIASTPYAPVATQGSSSDHNISATSEFQNLTFADANADAVAANLKNNVQFLNNVTLTVNGTLNVFGSVAPGQSNMTGGTYKEYSQLTLGNRSTISIESGATLVCTGYIKEVTEENGSQVINYGTIKQPFVIYDFKGARETIGLYMGGSIVPFSQFDMPNIHTEVKHMKVGKTTAMVSMFTNELYKSAAGGLVTIDVPADSHFSEFTVIASSNALINLTGSNAYLISKYVPATFGYTVPYIYSGNNKLGRGSRVINGVASDCQYTKLEFHGDANNGSMNIGVTLFNADDPVPIDTSASLFPVSFRVSVVIDSGVFSVAQQVKLLPGSDIHVCNGATLNVNSKTLLYSKFVSATSSYYPANLRASYLLNEGTTNCNAEFFGRIDAGENLGETNAPSINANGTSILEGRGSFSTDVTISQGLALLGYYNGTSTFNSVKSTVADLSSVSYYSNNHIEYFQKRLYNFDTASHLQKISTDYQNIVTSGSYTSVSDSQGNHGWWGPDSTYQVAYKFVYEGSVVDAPTIGSLPVAPKNNGTVYSLDLSGLSYTAHQSASAIGCYLDESCSSSPLTSFVGSVLYDGYYSETSGCVTIYVLWEEVSDQIVVSYIDYDGSTIGSMTYEAIEGTASFSVGDNGAGGTFSPATKTYDYDSSYPDYIRTAYTSLGWTPNNGTNYYASGTTYTANNVSGRQYISFRYGYSTTSQFKLTVSGTNNINSVSPTTYKSNGTYWVGEGTSITAVSKGSSSSFFGLIWTLYTLVLTDPTTGTDLQSKQTTKTSGNTVTITFIMDGPRNLTGGTA